MPSSIKAKSSKVNREESSSSSSSSEEEQKRKPIKKTTKKNKPKDSSSSSSSSSTKDVKTRKINTKKVTPAPKSSQAPKASQVPKSSQTSPVVEVSLGGFEEFVTIKTSMNKLRDSLPLDFTDTPMTPDEIKQRFGTHESNVIGLNILLGDEEKLVIPKQIRSTLKTLFVTSSRVSGNIKLKDISVLSECLLLEELSLAKCNILADLSSLQACKQLRVLDLSHCSSLKTLSGGSDTCFFSTRLENLNLSYCSMLVDVECLKSIHHIKSLDLSHCESLTSLPPLAFLNQLEVLDLSHCDSLTVVGDTSKIHNYKLKELNLHGSSLVDHCPKINSLKTFSVGSWNLLARGLEIDGFLTVDGLPSVEWKSRRDKVVNVLNNMLKVNEVVVTQENDNFFWLLNNLRLNNPNIRGVWCCKTLPPKEAGGDFTSSNARAFYIKRMAKFFLDQGHIGGDDAKTVEELMKLAPKDFSPKCSELYNLVNKANMKTPIFNTFAKELGSSAKFSELYGLGPEDTFISDDGIGFYYDSSKVALLPNIGSHLFSSVSPEKCARYGMVGETPILWHKDGWVDVSFQCADGNTVTVFGAHLPSGEDEKAEGERLGVAKTMISSLNDQSGKCIFAMDSNVSLEYEASFDMNVELASNHFITNGFSDAIQLGTFPCFKMRGPGSEQKKKIGELFVDQIDKILYRQDEMYLLKREHPLDEYGFQRLSRAAYKEVHQIRTIPEFRETNNETIKRGGKNAVVKDIYTDPFTPFAEIYPGPNSPSDHPPISATFLFERTPEYLTHRIIKEEPEPEPEKKTVSKVEKTKREPTPEPKEKTKVEPTPEPEKKTVTKIESEPTPEKKTKKSPRKKEWTLEELQNKLEELVTDHYTTSRENLNLKPYSDTEVKKILKEKANKRGKIAESMFNSMEDDDYNGYKDEDFKEWLSDNNLLPKWDEEVKKAKKISRKK